MAAKKQAWTILEGDAATLDEIKRLGGDRLAELLDLVTPDDRAVIAAMTDRGRRMSDLIDKAAVARELDGVVGWWRQAMLKRLADARPVGGTLPIANKSGKAKDITERVAEKLPASWIDQLDASRPYKVQYKKGSRGWHNGGERKIELPDSSTAVHEWIHAIQTAIPQLDALFQAEHRRRTAGEALEWLGDPYGRNEIGRRDHYVSVYFGKEYGARGALEVITMTYQAVLGDDPWANRLLSMLLKSDPDLVRLALGALFHFK